MSDFLFQYHEVKPTTWVYLSSLLLIGLFFKFSRLWSVRNLDLVMLILLSPGLLLVHYGKLARYEQFLEATGRVAEGSDAGGVASAPTVTGDGIGGSSTRTSPKGGAGALESGSPDARPTEIPAAASSAAETSVAAPTPVAKPSTDSSQSGPSVAPTATGAGPADLAAASVPPAAEPAAEEGAGSASVAGETVPGSERDLSVAERAAVPGSPAGPDAPAELRRAAEQRGLTDGVLINDEAEASENAQSADGHWLEGVGFIWLFIVGLLLMIRLLIDPTMVRRPLLEPNLSAGGLVFIACSLFVFLMANVISDSPSSPRLAVTYGSVAGADVSPAFPNRVGYGILWMVPPTVVKIVVVGSHLAIVVGLVVVGFRHFANTIMGIGAATLYLMLPYSSLLTGRIDHVLPAAALIWGVVCYRRPILSGMLTGIAGGLVFYPLFLFPLWASFYWQRGLVRYVLGWLGTLAVMTIVLLSVSSEPRHSLQLMYGLVSPSSEWVMGAWDADVTGWDSVYRWPILAAFLVLSLSLALWPAQKNLGTLLSCSAALMVGSQFWHAQDGGIYMAWYLPLVLLTIFRPNLEDRVAVSVLGDRRGRLRNVLSSVDLAA